MPSKLPLMVGAALQVVVLCLALAACDITNPPFPFGQKPPEVITPLPTVLPTRDVTWLTELISATETITITAWDTPDLMVRMDQTMRDRLVDAVEGHTTPAVYGDIWHTLRRPYPQYLLVFGSGESPTTLYWLGPGHIGVDFTDTEGYRRDALYQQADDALWNTLQEIAPPPRHSPDDLRYLMVSSSATCTQDGQTYWLGPDLALDVARGFAVSTPVVEEPGFAPAVEPQLLGDPRAVYTFTVGGQYHRVEMWDEVLRYAGRDYKQRNLFAMLREVCDNIPPNVP